MLHMCRQYSRLCPENRRSLFCKQPFRDHGFQCCVCLVRLMLEGDDDVSCCLFRVGSMGGGSSSSGGGLGSMF